MIKNTAADLIGRNEGDNDSKIVFTQGLSLCFCCFQMCGAVVVRPGEVIGIMKLLELRFEKKNRAKTMYSWLQTKNKL